MEEKITDVGFTTYESEKGYWLVEDSTEVYAGLDTEPEERKGQWLATVNDESDLRRWFSDRQEAEAWCVKSLQLTTTNRSKS